MKQNNKWMFKAAIKIAWGILGGWTDNKRAVQAIELARLMEADIKEAYENRNKCKKRTNET